MRNTIFAFVIIGLFISCRGDHKGNANVDTTIKPTSNTQSLIDKFKPIIQGAWVKKDYIEKISQTKSPLAAMDEAGDIIIMDINMKNIKSDSLIVPDGDTHEGSQITIKFQNGKLPTTVKVSEGGEIGYSINKGDTILFYSRLDYQNKKVITTKFIKVLQELPDDDLEFGLAVAINKAIITGNYMLTDSIGKVSKVNFYNDGKISGFLDFSKYHISSDLNSDPMDNLDQVGFDIHTKHHNIYSFKIDKDTLNLYTTKPNSDSTLVLLDKLKYKLVKQK